MNINSSNVGDEKMKRANKLFETQNLFQGALNAKVIKPMFSDKLDKKQRILDREKNAGAAWGSMEKVELTEELKYDLKTIKFRN